MNKFIEQYRRINFEDSTINKIYKEFRLNVPARPTNILKFGISKRQFMNHLKELNNTRHLRKLKKIKGPIELGGKIMKMENEYFLFGLTQNWWGRRKRAFYLITPHSALMCLKLNLIAEDSNLLHDEKIKNILKEILDRYQEWELGSIYQQNELFNEEVIKYKYRLAEIPEEEWNDKLKNELKITRSNRKFFREISKLSYLKKIMINIKFKIPNGQILEIDKWGKFLYLLEASPEMWFFLTMHKPGTDYLNIDTLFRPLLINIIDLFYYTGNLGNRGLIKRINKLSRLANLPSFAEGRTP